MELKDVIQQMVDEAVSARMPTELQIGTVTGVSPLEITLDTQMTPLRQSVLYLSETVVEKKIPVLEHTHQTAQGATQPALLQSEIICDEHGTGLGVKDNSIIFNNALQVGDKVLLMRVQGGQKFVILSRTFDFK